MDLTRVVWACKGSETKIIRFSTIHDFPDIVSHVPSNECLMSDEEKRPVFLEDLF